MFEQNDHLTVAHDSRMSFCAMSWNPWLKAEKLARKFNSLKYILLTKVVDEPRDICRAAYSDIEIWLM